MSAVVVSSDDVVLDPSSASISNMPSRIAAEAIAPGDVVAIDPATDRVVKAQATASPSYVKVSEGIALNGAEEGQPVRIAKSGKVALSSTACMVVGVVYCLSPGNAGQLVPHADISAGQLVQVVGLAISTTQLQLGINNSGLTRGS